MTKKREPSSLPEVVDRHDRRVVHLGDDLGFPLEAALDLGRQVGRGDQLDGDLAVQERVSGPVDDTHAAPAELADDLVSVRKLRVDQRSSLIVSLSVCQFISLGLSGREQELFAREHGGPRHPSKEITLAFGVRLPGSSAGGLDFRREPDEGREREKPGVLRLEPREVEALDLEAGLVEQCVQEREVDRVGVVRVEVVG